MQLRDGCFRVWRDLTTPEHHDQADVNENKMGEAKGIESRKIKQKINGEQKGRKSESMNE